MSTTDVILDHLAGEDAARKTLRDIEAGTADTDALWTTLAGLPQAQRRGACRIFQKALERIPGSLR